MLILKCTCMQYSKKQAFGRIPLMYRKQTTLSAIIPVILYNLFKTASEKLIILTMSLGLVSINNRSSRPEVFCKKRVLRNFTKFTGKHLCQSLFFNKVT